MNVSNNHERPKRRELTLAVYEAPVLIARNTYRVRMQKPGGFEFVPGQSIKTNFKNEHKLNGDWRCPSFTIVSAPHEPYLELMFRADAEYDKRSPTKKSLTALQVGESIPMLGVLEDKSDEVLYPPESEVGRPIVMLAGGVGIAPFISMMRHAAHIKDRREFYLMYANPTKEDITYEDEVVGFGNSLSPNVRLQQFLTQESREGYASGYFDPESIRSILARSVRGIPLFYISGAVGMVEETRKLLQKMQVPDSCIRVKSYTGYEGMDTIRG